MPAADAAPRCRVCHAALPRHTDMCLVCGSLYPHMHAPCPRCDRFAGGVSLDRPEAGDPPDPDLHLDDALPTPRRLATLASRGQLRLRCSACLHEWRPEANEILAAFELPLFTLADRIAQGYERRARRPLPYRGVLLTLVPTLASRYLASLLTFDVTPLLLYDLRNLLPGEPPPTPRSRLGLERERRANNGRRRQRHGAGQHPRT